MPPDQYIEDGESKGRAAHILVHSKIWRTRASLCWAPPLLEL